MRILATCLALAFLAAPAFASEERKSDFLVVTAPNPVSAFFCGFPILPGGGQLYSGDPLKGTIYLGAGAAGAALGFLSYGWTGQYSEVPNDSETYVAIGLGAIAFILVGTIAAIDASLSANGKNANIQSVLESPP
ncbi:MAG TPA: hypothetical protein DD435_09950 [Cyanobacteria bacterium UBA8530]|nr:hypothetical protein [Cyanobacteria bacterium UBA8530]